MTDGHVIAEQERSFTSGDEEKFFTEESTNKTGGGRVRSGNQSYIQALTLSLEPSAYSGST